MQQQSQPEPRAIAVVAHCKCSKPISDGDAGNICLRCKKSFGKYSKAPRIGGQRGDAYGGKHRLARIQRFEAKQRRKRAKR